MTWKKKQTVCLNCMNGSHFVTYQDSQTESLTFACHRLQAGGCLTQTARSYCLRSCSVENLVSLPHKTKMHIFFFLVASIFSWRILTVWGLLHTKETYKPQEMKTRLNADGTAGQLRKCAALHSALGTVSGKRVFQWSPLTLIKWLQLTGVFSLMINVAVFGP